MWVVLIQLAIGSYSLLPEYQENYGDDNVTDNLEDQVEHGHDYVIAPDIPEETILLKTPRNNRGQSKSPWDGFLVSSGKDDSHLAFLGL